MPHTVQKYSHKHKNTCPFGQVLYCTKVQVVRQCTITIMELRFLAWTDTANKRAFPIPWAPDRVINQQVSRVIGDGIRARV